MGKIIKTGIFTKGDIQMTKKQTNKKMVSITSH